MFRKEKALKVSKGGLRAHPFTRFLMGALAFSLASCSASGGTRAKPQESETTEETALTQTGGAKRLAESLVNSLSSGLSLKLDEMTLKADEKNTFVFNEGTLSFDLKELSLHGLNLALHSEVDYNGSGGRSIDARLVDDELYFALEAPGSKESVYKVAYKVSTAPYLIEEEDSRDEVTGGEKQYEFGRLDWILEDILQILSNYGYEVKPRLDSSSSVDFSKISSSLDDLSEIDAETHYFVWNLPIGEDVYSIGLQGDEDYCLEKIDFPAKGSGASSKLPNGMELSLSAEFDYAGAAIAAPSNASSYLPLDNSIDLWERIAEYAGKLSFDVSTSHEENGSEEEGLVLTHHEDDVQSTATTIGRTGFDEKITFLLNGGANFQSSKINDLSINATFKGEKQTKKLSGHYRQGETDQEAYLDINSIMKVKTSKTTADAFFSAFADLLGDESIKNEYLSSLFSAVGSIGDAFESLKNSLLGKDVSEGHYEHFLEALTSLESKDNQVEATFDFAKAGGEGKLIFRLSSSDFALASLTFDSLSLGGFGVSGTLKISDYTGASSFDKDSYQEMDHLPTLTEQVESLYQHHSAKAKLKGYVAKRGTTASSDQSFLPLNGKALAQEGFSLEGNFAFNLQEKAACANAVFVDRKADYLNEHALSLQLDGEIGASEETGDLLFSYDSSNANKANQTEGYKDLDYGNITEPSSDSLYGKFSVSCLNDILELATTLLGSDDPRFTKFTSAKDTLATTLVAKIAQGQFAPLLSEQILVSASRTGDRISAVISKDVLGSEENVPLNICFNENGLSSIDIFLVTSTKEIYFKIDVEIPSSTLSKTDLQIADLQSKRGTMKDFSTLSTLLEYVLGSATLGEDENNVSTYHLSGTAKLSVLNTINISLPFTFYVYLDGAEVRMIGTLEVPLKTAVNSGLFSGTRHVEFYFHTSGTDTDGTIFFHRVNDLDLLNKTTEDWAKVKTSDFTSNLIDWALSYIVGLNDTYMDQIKEADTSDEKGSSMHGEDIVSDYSSSISSASASWDLKLDLSSLSSSLTQPLSVKIEGKEVNAGSKKQKTLSSLSGSIGILKLLGIDPVITVTLNASLDNVSTGTYISVWNRNSSSSADTLTFYSPNKYGVNKTTVHSADAYASNYYDGGYLTSGNFASATLYVTPPQS